MRFLLAFLMASAVAIAAFAQDTATKPTLSAKSRSINAEITIEDKLRTDARLYQGLLKEAQQFIDERALESDKEWRADKTMFRMGPWEYERTYYLEAEAGPYISVSVIDFAYTGGAHPNQRTTAILWDRERGRRATIRELFREAKPGGSTLTKLAALIREEVAKEKEERGSLVTRPLEKDEWISAVKADFRTMGAPLLVPSTEAGRAAGITFHFSQYNVGAYAEGAYDAFLSWRRLEPFLTEQARGWFGGERAEVPQPEGQ